MLIWILVFGIIFIVSAVLAWKSMKDYHELPLQSGLSYSLFLISHPEALTLEVIHQLGQAAVQSKSILAFERLFRGEKKALVAVGPLELFRPFSVLLGLVELEDYSLREVGNNYTAWEIGLKKNKNGEGKLKSFTVSFPEFQTKEEFWWQLLLKPKKETLVSPETFTSLIGHKADADKAQDKFVFQAVIRAVIWVEDKQRADNLKTTFFNLVNEAGLGILPQAYSSSSIVKFYRDRSFPHSVSNQNGVEIVLTAEEIKSLTVF